MLRRIAFAALVAVLHAVPATAGVVNPDISVIGQPYIRITNDPADPARNRPALNLGEVETMLDAYLNPYARGTFILSFADVGVEVEEGYFQLLRGLPAGLTVKGGKYRVGFGKMNTMHPHQLPFAERFHVLGYLPGGESYDEVGVSLGERLPAPGDFSLTLNGDWLQGDTFVTERVSSGASNDPLVIVGEGADALAGPRPAFVENLSGFGQIGDRSGYELGFSGTQGTNNAAAQARTSIYDLYGKLKLWTSPVAYLIVQSELLHLDNQLAGWDSTTVAYTKTDITPNGGYIYADYNFKIRYDAGIGYEHYQEADPGTPWSHAFKLFAGYSLLEETTVFRLDWDHWVQGALPGFEAPPAVDTVTLRVIFSMGPHKAHQF